MVWGGAVLAGNCHLQCLVVGWRGEKHLFLIDFQDGKIILQSPSIWERLYLRQKAHRTRSGKNWTLPVNSLCGFLDVRRKGQRISVASGPFTPSSHVYRAPKREHKAEQQVPMTMRLKIYLGLLLSSLRKQAKGRSQVRWEQKGDFSLNYNPGGM